MFIFDNKQKYEKKKHYSAPRYVLKAFNQCAYFPFSFFNSFDIGRILDISIVID